MAARRRLDAELLRRGLVSSRAEAQRTIAQGRVTVAGAPARKPATLVDRNAAVVLRADAEGWASRGAHKLLGALDALSVPVAGRRCLDAGAAHGGFTDVLLRRGAVGVVAVDVGYGQLDWRLRADERVTVLERVNVRQLTPEQIGSTPELVVADLSFVSLRLALPVLISLAAAADFLLLVKPQFEVGRERVGKGGVVRDPENWRAAIVGVVATATDHGLGLCGACVSPLPGPAGNIEFFVHLARRCAGRPSGDVIATALTRGTALRDGIAVGLPSPSEHGPAYPPQP